MASKPSKRWDEDNLLIAIEEIKQGKLKAELEYGIPKSILFDNVTGKVKVGRRQGSKPALTKDDSEEQTLVQWALAMNKIGTRRQTVNKILDKDGRHNPFTDNQPLVVFLCM